MAMYNLFGCRNNYSMTSGSLWNYHRDEVNDDANETNAAGDHRKNNNNATTSRSFEYKTKNNREYPS